MIRAWLNYLWKASRLGAHQRKFGPLPCQRYSDCHLVAGHSGPHTHGPPCPERNPVAGWPCLRRSPEHLVHRDGHGAEWHLIGTAELDLSETDWVPAQYDPEGPPEPVVIRRQGLRWPGRG